MNKILFLCVLALPLLNYTAKGEELVQYEIVEGKSSLSGKTLEQARSEALNAARTEAVRIVAGVQVKSETFSIDGENSDDNGRDLFSVFQMFNRSFSAGQVVEEEILEDRLMPVIIESEKMTVYYYWIKLKAGVKLERGKVDPGFKLDLSLNKEVFNDGELMRLRLESTKDCYYTVFNILANDTIAVLYPNSRMLSNFLPANQELILPPPGTNLRVGLRPDKTQAQEMISVIATKDKIDFAEGELVQQPCKIISSYQAGLQQLARWLAMIPLDQRCEATQQYVIKR